MTQSKRRYERIEIELPCRLFIPEGQRSESLKFEAFATSANLSLGGVFVECTFLLRQEVRLYVELHLPDGPLPILGRIAHVVVHDHPEYATGMGIEFLDVETHGRETLLRYFTPMRYQQFYTGMIGEFPHLEKTLALPDISLVVNLWEEWKVQSEGGPPAIRSGVPLPPPLRRKSPKR